MADASKPNVAKINGPLSAPDGPAFNGGLTLRRPESAHFSIESLF
jgi:hypothetical protein